MSGSKVVGVSGLYVLLENGRVFKRNRESDELTELPPIPGSEADSTPARSRVELMEEARLLRNPGTMVLVGGPLDATEVNRPDSGWASFLEFPGEGKREVYERYIGEYRYREDLGWPEPIEEEETDTP